MSSIKQLLQKTKHHDPDERYMATSDLMVELEKLDGVLDIALQESIQETILRQKKRQNRKYVCGFVTLTILGAIVGSYLMHFKLNKNQIKLVIIIFLELVAIRMLSDFII